MTTFKGLGWKPDLPDIRDYPLTLKITNRAALPSHYSIKKYCPPVYDQGQLGSCVGQATAAAYAMVKRKQKLKAFTPSPLFVYYNARALDGTVPYDAGTYIRSGMKTVNSEGVSSKKLWPYNIPMFSNRPTDAAYKEAEKHQAIQYERVPQDLTSMKQCIYAGFPIVFGFSVYESFYSVGNAGDMPMPQQNERLLGGHAVVAVGYGDGEQKFLIRNSWGKGWGSGGYFWMPYAYITDPNLASDFWTLKLVE